MTPTELLADRWAFGPWCYQIGEVWTLQKPLKVPRGMLGLWPLTMEVQAALRASLGVEVERAVTLQQPYATAIAGYHQRPDLLIPGPKRVENRPKPVFGRTVPPGGMWAAIHAAKALYENAEELVAAWRSDGGLWPASPRLEDMPRSAILGVMRIDHCLPYDATPAGRPRQLCL